MHRPMNYIQETDITRNDSIKHVNDKALMIGLSVVVCNSYTTTRSDASQQYDDDEGELNDSRTGEEQW